MTDRPSKPASPPDRDQSAPEGDTRPNRDSPSGSVPITDVSGQPRKHADPSAETVGQDSSVPAGDAPLRLGQSPPADSPNLSKGSLVKAGTAHGRLQEVAGYEILEVLGRGATGVVYKARQRALKRIVALKMVLSGEHASEQDLVRFFREAEATAELKHPNIVQVYELGEQDGLPFLSQEYVEGGTLPRP